MSSQKRLWEVDHPYYWQEGNYYSNDNHETYKSWSAFLKAMGDADEDLNLLCRWDWREGEEWDVPPEEACLMLGYVAQRKARIFSVEIKVTRADEPAIREWLTKKWTKITQIWDPFSRQGDL